MLLVLASLYASCILLCMHTILILFKTILWVVLWIISNRLFPLSRGWLEQAGPDSWTNGKWSFPIILQKKTPHQSQFSRVFCGKVFHWWCLESSTLFSGFPFYVNSRGYWDPMNGHSNEFIMNGSSMGYFWDLFRCIWKMPLILLKIEEVLVLLQCPDYSDKHPTWALSSWEPIFNGYSFLMLPRTSCFHLGSTGTAKGIPRAHSDSCFSWSVFLGRFQQLNYRLVHQKLKIEAIIQGLVL